MNENDKMELCFDLTLEEPKKKKTRHSISSITTATSHRPPNITIAPLPFTSASTVAPLLSTSNLTQTTIPLTLQKGYCNHSKIHRPFLCWTCELKINCIKILKAEIK
jgi:hypothetical protein